MPFDPTKPFKVKEGFDPDRPFNVVSDDRDYSLSKVLPEGLEIASHTAEAAIPYRKTIGKAVGTALGRNVEEDERKRAERAAYLSEKYGSAYDLPVGGTSLVKSFALSAIPGVGPWVAAGEPLVEQAVSDPESLGINLETGINALPTAITAATKIPAAISRGIAKIKETPTTKAATDAYSKDPERYEAAIANASESGPFSDLIEEGTSNLSAIEAKIAKQEGISKQAKLTGEQRADRLSNLQSQRKFELANAEQDLKAMAKVDAEGGDTAQAALSEINNIRNQTAAVRNKNLEENGIRHDVFEIDNWLREGLETVTDPTQRASINNARKALRTKSREFVGDNVGEAVDETLNTIPSRQLNDYRMFLQDQVNYTNRMTPAGRVFNSVANKINDVLDDNIIGNDQLRATIRQQTKDLNKAESLVGGDYNTGKIGRTLSDEQKLADVVDIVSRNPNLGFLEDYAARIKSYGKFKDLKARGSLPSTYDEEIAYAEKLRQNKIKQYVESKKIEEALKSGLPFSSKRFDPVIKQSMYDNPANPRPNAIKELQRYADEVHPQGPEDFANKYHEAEVYKGLTQLDRTNGSRMTLLGKSIGSAVGGVAGGFLGGDEKQSFNPITAGMGAVGGFYGARMDSGASSAFRSGIRTTKALKPVATLSSTEQAGRLAETLTEQTGRLIEALIGTKYEGIARDAASKGPQSLAVTHYIMSSRDPEYQSLVGGIE